MAGKSVYEMVTDRIIAQLEQEIIPWEKPWSGIRSGAYNRVSKKSYSLINQMMLLHDGEYAIFKQWQGLGGHVRKGAKSEMVVFWKIMPVEEKQKDGAIIKKNIPLLRCQGQNYILIAPCAYSTLNNSYFVVLCWDFWHICLIFPALFYTSTGFCA